MDADIDNEKHKDGRVIKVILYDNDTTVDTATMAVVCPPSLST
jgi:hypothetical protein